MSDSYEAVTFARSTDRPLVRASYMKRFVDALVELPEGVRLEIEQTRAAELASIREANGLSWLPFEVNHALTRELGQRLEAGPFDAFFRSMFGKVWRSPLLETLTDYVIRLTGRDVGGAARFFSRGFPQIFRNAGSWALVQKEDGRVVLEFFDFPDACLEDSNLWLESVRASLGSVFRLVELEGGEVDLRVETEPATRAIFELRWRWRGAEVDQG